MQNFPFCHHARVTEEVALLFAFLFTKDARPLTNVIKIMEGQTLTSGYFKPLR